jgi:ketosteroid isomerase-like protein
MELARRGLSAFSRGDMDGTLATVHPDIEWYVAFRIPDLPILKDVYRGHHEVRELWHAFRSGWESLAIDLEEFLHVDDERVVLRVRFVGRGAESGIEVDRTLFYAYRMRDGLLVYSRAWDDEGSARRDLGLDA